MCCNKLVEGEIDKFNKLKEKKRDLPPKIFFVIGMLRVRINFISDVLSLYHSSSTKIVDNCHQCRLERLKTMHILLEGTTLVELGKATFETLIKT